MQNFLVVVLSCLKLSPKMYLNFIEFAKRLFIFDRVHKRNSTMENFGSMIRRLREEKELPLRVVAAYIDLDQGILSKIERGQKSPMRQQVVKLAEFFGLKPEQLVLAWLSDKVFYELENEEMAFEALQLAEERLRYLADNKRNTDLHTLN
jgi:transcriptional regulator with XRE-family HTH domain